ncbi:MAG TPA: hypothetical protein VKM72_02840 [Thermoanaerobaculia bacterium]|nr:hypothetical protein [Thermoanaerobaculia bacterium]
MMNDRFSDIASAGNLVRVTIPVKVANDLKSMQRVTASILGQLGCEGCHSGFDIRYDVVREFVVNEQLDVKAVGG